MNEGAREPFGDPWGGPDSHGNEPTVAGERPDAIPSAVHLFICDRCGRQDFSYLGIRPNHWHRGERCGGTVQEVRYVRA